MQYNAVMTACQEILLMKKKFAADHDGQQANVIYVSDPKWRQWWGELSRVGNPDIEDALSTAIARKGFAGIKGRVWNGLRVERLNPNERPQFRTFVAHEEPPAPAAIPA
jgi:hypothetical protein